MNCSHRISIVIPFLVGTKDSKSDKILMSLSSKFQAINLTFSRFWNFLPATDVPKVAPHFVQFKDMWKRIVKELDKNVKIKTI